MPREGPSANPKRYRWIILTGLVVILGVFALDALTRRGFAEAVLYVIPVLLTIWVPQWRSTLVVAVLCTGLVIVGCMASSPGAAEPISLSNRFYAMLIIWAAAGIAVQRKESQATLQRAHDKLEQRVRERTAELSQANDRLQHENQQRQRTEEELRRSNKELEQLAFVASHDLNEPLRTIKMYLEFIEKKYRDRLNSAGQRDLLVVLEGASRMQSLINDLLEAAKIRSQGRPFAPVNCTMVVQQSLETLQATITETQAQVILDALPVIQADSRQMVQLFQNLIGNALKYRSDNAPLIHVSATEDNDHWLFSVRDNGIGIDPKFTKKVFRMFTRLHDRLKYPGTGIGLALCERIVERHGGAIWVESEVGQGSTFYFTIPKHRPPTVETNVPTSRPRDILDR